MQSDYRLLYIIAYSSVLSALIPLIAGLYKFKQRSIELKLLCILSLLALCVDCISQLNQHIANEFINVFTLIEFFIILYIYRESFQFFSKPKAILAITVIFYLVLFSAELLSSSKVNVTSYSLTFTSLLFIVITVSYFYSLMRDLPTDKIQRLPMFWVNTGVLIYFAGGLFLFAMRNYVIAAFHDDQTVYWTFHNFLNIVKNILFAVAMWQQVRKFKSV